MDSPEPTTMAAAVTRMGRVDATRVELKMNRSSPPRREKLPGT